MTNIEAVDRMVVALGDRLTDDQAAFVEATRGLARVVDSDTADLSAWREYRLMLLALQEVVSDGDADQVQELLDRFTAEVRDKAD
jgi:hypothetical protein